jgi:membrane-bound lytic murein transglycosylase D
MQPTTALCFAAVAVSLTFPATVQADGALLSGPNALTSAIPAFTAGAARGSPTLQPAAAPSPAAVPAVSGLTEQPDAAALTPPDSTLTPVTTIDDPAQPEVYVTGEPIIEWHGPDEAEQAYEDLWSRIRAGFAMREIDSPLVQRHEAWYLNRPEYVERMIDRSRRYLYHIVEEVEKRGMPTEIALLPMIESAFNPVAYSRMRAAGMWQFIPSTGRRYGLQQTWWYDGRRDVLAATDAALDYLQALHDMFGDWELALAAYNWGEGAVQRAIAKNRRAGKKTNYMSLKMPKETRNYLPKLQAVKNIVANPELFKLALATVPNRPYFAVVNVPSHIDMAMAAKLADVPLEEFRYLNPGHQRPVITPVANRHLLVPIDKVDVFQSNLESNEQPLVTWQTYQLKKSEQLEQVAEKFDISVERLKDVNGLTNRKRVRPGQMLLVPVGDDAQTNLDETYLSTDFQAPADDYHKRVIYRVKSGDTLSSIARRYGTSVARLKDWNGLRSNMVRTGQRLTIWQEAPQAKGRKTAKASAGKKAKTAQKKAPAAKARTVSDSPRKAAPAKVTGG